MIIVKINKQGISRVLNGEVGMTFIVDKFGGVSGKTAHVRDYRFDNTNHNGKDYQIWSIGYEGYEEIKE